MTGPRSVACREQFELISDYLDGATDSETMARIERHLAECPGCVGYLTEMRATVALLGTITLDQLTDDTVRGLEQAFRSWRSAG